MTKEWLAAAGHYSAPCWTQLQPEKNAAKGLQQQFLDFFYETILSDKLKCSLVNTKVRFQNPFIWMKFKLDVIYDCGTGHK